MQGLNEEPSPIPPFEADEAGFRRAVQSEYDFYKHCADCPPDIHCCTREHNVVVVRKIELEYLKTKYKELRGSEGGERSNELGYDEISESQGALFKLRLEEGRCPFFKDGRCSVHSTKPLDCLLWPAMFDIDKENGPIRLDAKCPAVRSAEIPPRLYQIDNDIKKLLQPEEKKLYAQANAESYGSRLVRVDILGAATAQKLLHAWDRRIKTGKKNADRKSEALASYIRGLEGDFRWKLTAENVISTTKWFLLIGFALCLEHSLTSVHEGFSKLSIQLSGWNLGQAIAMVVILFFVFLADMFRLFVPLPFVFTEILVRNATDEVNEHSEGPRADNLVVGANLSVEDVAATADVSSVSNVVTTLGDQASPRMNGELQNAIRLMKSILNRLQGDYADRATLMPRSIMTRLAFISLATFTCIFLAGRFLYVPFAYFTFVALAQLADVFWYVRLKDPKEHIETLHNKCESKLDSALKRMRFAGAFRMITVMLKQMFKKGRRNWDDVKATFDQFYNLFNLECTDLRAECEATKEQLKERVQSELSNRKKDIDTINSIIGSVNQHRKYRIIAVTDMLICLALASVLLLQASYPERFPLFSLYDLFTAVFSLKDIQLNEAPEVMNRFIAWLGNGHYILIVALILGALHIVNIVFDYHQNVSDYVQKLKIIAVGSANSE